MQPKPHVVFATPCLTNNVSIEFFNSALETNALLLANGIYPVWLQLGGDPYLAKVRCRLMTKFFEDFPETDNFFFIDDDVGWPAHKAVEFVLNPNPVLSGIYCKKQDTLDFPVVLGGDPVTGELIKDQGFVMAQEVPTGFLRLKRAVVEKLAATSSKFKSLDKDGNLVHYVEFMKMGTGALDADEWWVGEDNDLSRRINAAGFNIWVDPEISFTHRGGKIWRATLADFLPKFGLAKPAEQAA